MGWGRTPPFPAGSMIRVKKAPTRPLQLCIFLLGLHPPRDRRGAEIGLPYPASRTQGKGKAEGRKPPTPCPLQYRSCWREIICLYFLSAPFRSPCSGGGRGSIRDYSYYACWIIISRQMAKHRRLCTPKFLHPQPKEVCFSNVWIQGSGHVTLWLAFLLSSAVFFQQMKEVVDFSFYCSFVVVGHFPPCPAHVHMPWFFREEDARVTFFQKGIEKFYFTSHEWQRAPLLSAVLRKELFGGCNLVSFGKIWVEALSYPHPHPLSPERVSKTILSSLKNYDYSLGFWAVWAS